MHVHSMTYSHNTQKVNIESRLGGWDEKNRTSPSNKNSRLLEQVSCSAQSPLARMHLGFKVSCSDAGCSQCFNPISFFMHFIWWPRFIAVFFFFLPSWKFYCQGDEVSHADLWQRFNIAGKKKKVTNYWERRGQCNVREIKTFTRSTDAAVSVFDWFRTSEVFTKIHFHLCSHWSARALTPIHFSPTSLICHILIFFLQQ